MRPIEALNWLKTKLQEIDTKIHAWMPENAVGGIQLKFSREVTARENLHEVLQPPQLQGKIEDLLQEAGNFQFTFNVKHYPEPVARGIGKPRTVGTVTYPGDTFFKEGGWGGGYSAEGAKRTLYNIGVVMQVEPIMCPPEILRHIEGMLKNGTWTDNLRHLRGKPKQSKYFVPGEQVVRQRDPKPDEILYFITTYKIPGGGGVRCVKINPKTQKQSLISIQSAYKAGA